MKNQTSLGALLRRYRLEAGLSQEALAAQANISARAISDLERGVHRSAHLDTLDLLAKALSLSPQQSTLLLAAAHPEIDAASATPTSLPISHFPLPPNRLIGRKDAQRQAEDYFRGAQGRLLTITGPSGVGKTRLALQVARSLEDDFPAGVLFFDLAPLRDSARLPEWMVQALALREQEDRSVIAQLIAFFQNRNVLLFLDNFEQIVKAAPFIADLLAWCSGLRVLVTSRTPLHIRGEQILPLAPLELPEAISLFKERAQSVSPNWLATEAQLSIMCKRLDCLPLAIELAAGQVKSLPLEELTRRLTGRLVLLQGGFRDLPARQQTMRDAIDWSYELLSKEQQRCFRSLGVFAGGGSLEAAQAVCQSPSQDDPVNFILTLSDLVNASLVQIEWDPSGASRFSLFELIAEYALEQLRSVGEETHYRKRHASYYADLADKIPPFGSAARVADTQLARDYANARTALEWAQTNHEIELGLRIILGFGKFWFTHGQVREALYWFETYVSLADQADWKEQQMLFSRRNEAFYHACYGLLVLGKHDQAKQMANAGLRRAEESGNFEGMSAANGILGLIAQARGQLDEAMIFFEKSDDLLKRSEGAGFWLQGTVLLHWAELTRQKGDLVKATGLFEQILSLAQGEGVPWIRVNVLTLLGLVASQQADYPLAEQRYREALAIYREYDDPTHAAWCLEGYASVLCAQKRYPTAVRLCAAADALRAKAGTPLPPAEHERYDQVLRTAKAAMPSASFEQEWRTGALLDKNQVIDEVLKKIY